MKKSLKKLYKYAKRRIAGEGVINFRGKGAVNLIDVGSAGDLPSPWKENSKLISNVQKCSHGLFFGSGNHIPERFICIEKVPHS